MKEKCSNVMPSLKEGCGKFSSYPNYLSYVAVAGGTSWPVACWPVRVSGVSCQVGRSSKLRWCGKEFELSVERPQGHEKVLVLSWWEDSGNVAKMRKYKGLDNDVLQELASGWKQMVLLEVSCKGHMKNWLMIMEEKKKSIGHQVITLIESLNSHCANIDSRFYYDKKGSVLLFIQGLKYFSYFSFLLLVATNLND